MLTYEQLTTSVLSFVREKRNDCAAPVRKLRNGNNEQLVYHNNARKPNDATPISVYLRIH